MEHILKLGLPGGIGFLLGLIVMTWVSPTTNAGRLLIIIVCIIATITIGQLVVFLFKKFSGQKKDIEENPEN